MTLRRMIEIHLSERDRYNQIKTCADYIPGSELGDLNELRRSSIMSGGMHQ